MLDKNFDQYLRDRINNHTSDIPDDMWKRIIGEEKKDRKIFLLWRWYVAGAALVLIALCLMKIAPHHANPSPALSPTVAAATSSSTPASVPLAPAPSPTRSPAVTVSHSSVTATPPTPPIPATTPIPPSSVDPSPAQKPGASPSNLPPAPNSSGQPHQTPSPDLAGSPNLAGSPDKAVSTKSDRPAQTITPLPNPPPHNPPGLQFGDNNRNWYLEAMASPDWPLTKYPALSYTLGVRVIRTFGPRWSLVTGLQYSRINLKYHLDSLSSLFPHHYNNIDLPLLVGYHLKVAHPERLDPTINAGVVFNLYSRYGDPQDSYTSRGKIGLSLYLGLNLAQALTDRLSLFEEPYVRYQLSNMISDPYLPPQRISVGGIFLGIRYGFKKSSRLDCPHY